MRYGDEPWTFLDHGILFWILSATAFLLTAITLLSSTYMVREKTNVIIERLGRFHRLAHPGLRLKLPWGIDRVVYRASLQVMSDVYKLETKTKDNVIVTIEVSPQTKVVASRVKEAYYELDDPDEQMQQYVENTIRGHVPGMTLDELYEQQDKLGDYIQAQLSTTMAEYGYAIVKVPVTNIEPATNVKESMNEINAAQRQRVAALERGEAEKIIRVKAAEAEAEAKRLQGEGVANQRRAIAEGLRQSVADLATATGADGGDVMRTLLMVQFFDTLKEVGQGADSRVLFIPYTPGGLADLQQQLVAAMEIKP